MRKTSLALAMLGVLFLTGCSTLKHNVGAGAPDGDAVASKRQWYILWGLVPINKVDGGEMAKGAGLTNNYTIKSQTSFLDCIINAVTGFATVSGQSVKVLAASGSTRGSAATAAAPALSGGNSLDLANKALSNKDYNNALKYFQDAANADPNSVAAYQGLGTSYYYLGQKEQALVQYRKALALNPSNKQLETFINAIK